MEKDSGHKKINYLCNVKENLYHFDRILSIIEQTNTSNELMDEYKPDYLQKNGIFKNIGNLTRDIIDTKQELTKKIHDIHYHLFARSPRLPPKFLDKIFNTSSSLFGRFQIEKVDKLQGEVIKNNYYFTSYIVHCQLQKFFSSKNDYALEEKTEPEPTAFEYTYYCLHILEKKSTELYSFLEKSKYFKLIIQISKNVKQIDIKNEDIECYFKYTNAYDPIMFLMYALKKYKEKSLPDAYRYVYENILNKMVDPLSTINEETAAYLYLIHQHCKNDFINQTIEKYIMFVSQKVLQDNNSRSVNEKAETYLHIIFPHYKNDYVSESMEKLIKSELYEEVRELNATIEKIKDADIIFGLVEKYKLYRYSNTLLHIYNENYCYEIQKLTNENKPIEQKEDNNNAETTKPTTNGNPEKKDIHKLLFLNYLFTKYHKDKKQ